MFNRCFWLCFLFVSLPALLLAESSHSFIIGGPIRYGRFKLLKSAEKIETTVTYDEYKLTNNFGKSLFINYFYDRYGFGIRWLSYALEGENVEIEQELELEYLFATFSVGFLEGNYLHPDINSRFGLSVGMGANHYRLSTKTNRALTSSTIKEKHASSGDATLMELFFESTMDFGFGYRLGYYRIDAEHDNHHGEYRTDASTRDTIHLMLIWRFGKN